jgi:hypothetical protein
MEKWGQLFQSTTTFSISKIFYSKRAYYVDRKIEKIEPKFIDIGGFFCIKSYAILNELGDVTALMVCPSCFGKNGHAKKREII